MTDTLFIFPLTTGEMAAQSDMPVDITTANNSVAKIPTNSNHNSSLEDISYNDESDLKIDKVKEEENKVI
jgi:hypothetical protein